MSSWNARIAALAGTLLLWGCGTGQTPFASPQSAAMQQGHVAQSASVSSRLTGSSASQAPALGPSSNVQRPERPQRPPTAILVTVDVLQNRHSINPYIYGVNFAPTTDYVADSGATFVRWGSTSSSRYNWTNFDSNSGASGYFANQAMNTNPLYQDSTSFVSTISGTGALPMMTIGLLPWTAKDATSASFSVAKYGAQCSINPSNNDQGSGLLSDCLTPIVGNDPADANLPFLDYPQDGDPANTVYRSQWVTALAPNWGAGPHFYGMDDDMDQWSVNHRDVHPDPVDYNEMRGAFLKIVKPIRSWDPSGMLFAPVSSSWRYYWNSAAGASDKDAWAGMDFVPWWLNEVVVSDRVEGYRSLDVFDVHAYTDSPDTSILTPEQKQALTLRLTRDWWDPIYTSESPSVNQGGVTEMQPLEAVPFRIPRLRAILNSIYPGTQMSISEWSAGQPVWGSAADGDFSTALADVDSFGILGRERVYAASRSTPAAANTSPYQALKLFRNYDGAHHAFGSMSVSAANSADPNLFSSFAATDASGTSLTVLLVNKSPTDKVLAAVALPNFTASTVTTYTLDVTNPQNIVASSPKSWTGLWTLAPYSATLLVLTGQTSPAPSVEWDLNPDTVMVSANATYDLHPHIVSGSGGLTLTSVQSDAGISLIVTQPNVTANQDGMITVATGAAPGFYHYSVTGTDNAGVQQTQAGWIVVGNPAATLAKIGDDQSAPAGSVVTLSVTLDPTQSGGTGRGASILFTTDGGSLPNRLARTNDSNTASVQLTLPSTPGVVHVTAEGPIPLGHPVTTFTINAQ